MRSTFVVLGSAVVIALAASQPSDTFLLSQCECAGLEFASGESQFFSNPFKLDPNAEDVLQCSGDDAFPNAPGFTTIFTNNTESTGLSTTASGDFFFDGESRTSWYVLMPMHIEFSSDAAVRLLDMKSGNKSLLTVDLITYDTPTIGPFSDMLQDWTLEVASEIGEGSFKIDGVAYRDTEFELVVGEQKSEFNSGIYAYVSLTYRTHSRILRRPGFMNLSAEDTLSVEILAGSTEGEPLEVQLHGVQFGRGIVHKFSLDDHFNFAPTAALPVVSQSQLQISGVEGESIKVDVTRFLEGGEVALEDLEISIQAADLDGSFGTNPFKNPFSYTPPKGFVGNKTFSFSYGVSQPYTCSNANIPVTIIIREASNLRTILLSIFIPALVVGGIIRAARVYKKKRAADANLAGQERDAKEVTV